MTMLELGRVVAVHPEDNSVDIVLVTTGARVPGVQVLAPHGSSNSGFTDLQEPAPSGDQWDNTQRREWDTFAAVGFFAGRPVVIGFLLPQVSEVLFKRKNFRVDRHASDWYQTIDDAGNVEWCHPSGSYLRVAEDPEHEDLTGQDFDKKWSQKRNLDKQPWLSVLLRNQAGGEVMRLRADPQGNVTLKHTENLFVETGGNGTVHIVGNASVSIDGSASVVVGGNAQVQVGGSTDIASGGSMHISAPDLTIDAPTKINGGATINGGASIAGSLANNGVNVGSSHTHGNVRVGPDRTSTPS